MTFGVESRARAEDLGAVRAEVERMAGHYYFTPQQTGIDRRTRQFIIDRCLTYVRGGHVLNLGYVDGQWADDLLGLGCRLDIVEGAERHADHARSRYTGNPAVRVFHKLFQEFEPDTRYGTIVAGDMIRYLHQPTELLGRARHWLDKDGHLIVTVPNSRSLHRRIGAHMDMVPVPHERNEQEQEIGLLRSYDRYEFRDLLQRSGLDVVALHGCFLKPLSSSQMENWSDELLRAFLEVGNELEDYCWFIYAVCRKGQ
jgi:hypothetical protein